MLGWAVCQAGKPAGEFSKSMAKKAAKGQPAKCTVCVANPPANNPPAAAAAAAVRHPEPKVSTPAHTKHLGWYLEFEFRHGPRFQKLVSELEALAAVGQPSAGPA